MDDKYRINSLATPTDNYRNAIRWGMYDVADMFIEDFVRDHVKG